MLKMRKAELKLSIDGHDVTFTGTPEEAVQFLHKVKAEGLPESEWYHSESKGWIRYQDMATAHIANALIKIQREWAADLKLSQFVNPHSFLMALQRGALDEKYVKGLLAEIGGRSGRMRDWKDR